MDLQGKASSRWECRETQGQICGQGFSQVEGIDYEETFAPVARYSSIRSILALSVQMGWKIHQMDVKTTFLNGVIEEEVYIEQPEGFETFNRESHVCRLKRALYGLKQAPVLGTPGSTTISPGWASPKVKQMQTFTILWLKVNY
jgi:hypothetical protein